MSKLSAKRYLQGERAHASGQRFEDRLNTAFALYRRQGIADIEKTPEPMRVIKRLEGGKFVAVFEKKAQADYSGVLRGGQAVIFEAKYTSSARMEQGRVTPEQVAFLERRQALGARCWVLAGFGSGNVYRVPWVVWRDMAEIFGRRSVTEKDLRDFVVPVMGGVPMVLEAVAP